MNNKLIAIFVAYIFCNLFFTEKLYCFELEPNIDMVSSGPFNNKNDQRERFRIVTILNEVYIKIYIQRLSYGEENCCAKIVSTYEIDDDNFEGENKLYSISNVSWLSYNSFLFTANSTKYIIRDIDYQYKCVRQ